MEWVFTGVGEQGDEPARPYRCLIDLDDEANWLIHWTWLDTDQTQRVLIDAEHAGACAWLAFLFSPDQAVAPGAAPAG